MSVPAAQVPGRDRRAGERRARLAEVARTLIGAKLSWLRGEDPPPPDADAMIEAMRQELRRRSGSAADAALVTDILHEAVDAWNLAHPLAPVAPPPAITPVRAEDHDWAPRKLDRLRRWRPFGEALAARLGQPDPAASPAERAGVVLASAIRHGGLADMRALAALALWLADPQARFGQAPGLPLWIDLFMRGPEEGSPEAGNGRRAKLWERRLAITSGEDAAGPYALRRWFVDPDSLAAIAAWTESGPDAGDFADLRDAAGSLAGISGLIARGLGFGSTPLALTVLIDGALAELELMAPAMDRAAISVARGRQPSFSPTPESWSAALGSVPDLVPDAVPLPVLAAAAGPRLVEEPEEDPQASLSFAALNRILASITPDVGTDLSAEPGRNPEALLAQRLEAADSSWWTPACLLLRDWYLAELGRGIKAPSVQRYHHAVALRLAAVAGAFDPQHAEAGELADLYSAVIDSDIRSERERGYLRRVLRRVHDWAEACGRVSGGVPPEVFEAEGVATRVRALIVPAAAILAVRCAIRTHPDLGADERLAIEALLILQWRAGLRIGEACKARATDLERTDRDPVLFIVRTPFGGNKTAWARRGVRPFALMTEEEASVFRSWLDRRSAFPAEGPLFGVAGPDGLAPFSPAGLGRLLGELLGEAGGCGASGHTLRHAALTHLHRAIWEARLPHPHPLVDRAALRIRLSGWTAAEAARAADSVAPLSMPRDAWRALSRHAGHRGPSITSQSYVHGWDLAIFEGCARRCSASQYDALARRLAARLRPLEPGRLPAGGLDAVPGAAGAWTPLRFAQVLEKLDGGEMTEAGIAAQLGTAGDIAASLGAARALAALRTRKGSPRLLPPGAEGSLAPHWPRSRAERREARLLMEEFWNLRGSLGADLAWWLAKVLLSATRSNTGIRLGTPEELRRCLEILERLPRKRRWSLHLEVPADVAGMDPWLEVAGEGVPRRAKRGIRSVIAVLRLPRPDFEDGETGLARISGDYASGAPVTAAHALAIALALGPEDLERALGR